MLLHSCFSSGLSLQTEVLYNPNLLSIIAFPDDSPVAAPVTLLLFFLFHLISPPLGIYCPSIITLPFLLFPPSPFYSASTVTLFNRCLSSCIFFATSDDFISLHCSTCVDAYEHGSSHMPTSFGAAIFTSSSFYSLSISTSAVHHHNQTRDGMPPPTGRHATSLFPLYLFLLISVNLPQAPCMSKASIYQTKLPYPLPC